MDLDGQPARVACQNAEQETLNDQGQPRVWWFSKNHHYTAFDFR